MDTNKVAKMHLGIVVDTAARKLGVSPDIFPIKPGGEVYLGDGSSNHYAAIANVPGVARNCQQAKDVGLVKRIFECRIVGGLPVLRVREWHYDRDYNKDYQIVYEGSGNGLGEIVTTELMIHSYNWLVVGGEAKAA
jgi:hypothetical protein